MLLKTEMCDWPGFHDQGGLGPLLGFGQDVISAVSAQWAQPGREEAPGETPGPLGRPVTVESAEWMRPPR